MERYTFMHTLSLALLLFAPITLRAHICSGDSLTLEQVWNIVDSASRQLKLSNLVVAASVTDVNIARDDRLPSLAVSGSALRNTTFNVYKNGLLSAPDYFPVSQYGYGFGYSFNLTLYEGGKYNRNVQLKKEAYLRQKSEYELQRNNVRYSAAVIFYDLYKFLQFRDFLLHGPLVHLAGEKQL